MNRGLKKFLILLIQSIIFWVVSILIFVHLRYFGIGEDEAFVTNPDLIVPMTEWLDLGVLLGVGIGFFYAVVETVFDSFIMKKISLGATIVLKTTIYLIVLVSITTATSLVAENRMDIDLNNDHLGWWHTDKTFWMVVLFFAMASLVFTFIKISIEKFGRDVFLKMLLGTYRKPKEEKHIFMFLDLKSSTTIAEKLGHIKYSKFIQDCFYDLNMVLEKYSAQVYQYVGDEAVLNWPYKMGTSDTKCIDLYFAFKKRLEERGNYYLERYDLQPQFKAGLHGGVLTVVEVGTVKKELAFHGDVINTTSRIQDECNTYDEHLLISEGLFKDIKDSDRYAANPMGKIELKGKERKLSIHAIKLNK